MCSVAFRALSRDLVALASFVAALLATAAPSQAQQSVSLPTIDVVSPTLVPTPSNQTASSVTVITAEDLARDQRRTVADALQAVPGLNVVQSGGPGGQAAVFMRGMNSNQVKVLIDGIDVGDPTTPNGAFDFAHLMTDDIERIEILRGPQSGLYGSDAMGGVISITTKRGSGPMKVTGTVEGGSFGTFNQSVGARGSEGNVDYSMNVQHFQSDDTPVMPQRFVAAGNPRYNNAYNNWTYSGNVGVKLNDDLSIRLIGRYTQASFGFTALDAVNFAPPMAEGARDPQFNHNANARAEAVWSPLPGLKNIFGVSYVSFWNRYIDPNPDSGFTSPVVLPPTTNLGQRTKFDWRTEAQVAPGHTLIVGAEQQRDTLRTDSSGITDAFFNYTPQVTNASTGNKAAFVELQSQINKNVSIASNIRYDDNDNFGGHATWRVTPVFVAPVTDTKLKASYGTGFRAPSLNELYVNFLPFLFFANPNLKPETSAGYDMGFEQPILNDRVRVGATYFHNDLTNLIQAVTLDPVTFASTLENVARAKTQGWETFVAVTVNSQFKVRADYTFTRSMDENTGLELLRRPKEKQSVTAIWTPVDRLSVSGTLLHVGEWADNDRQTFARIMQPGYTTVNAAANYAINQNVTVFGRIDNLFNKHYEDPNGFLRPGLGVYGGVRVSN